MSITNEKMKEEIFSLEYAYYNYVTSKDIEEYLNEKEIENVKSNNEEIFETLKKDSDYLDVNQRFESICEDILNNLDTSSVTS